MHDICAFMCFFLLNIHQVSVLPQEKEEEER